MLNTDNCIDVITTPDEIFAIEDRARDIGQTILKETGQVYHALYRFSDGSEIEVLQIFTQVSMIIVDQHDL